MATAEETLAALSGPHVQRAWFGEVDLPSGLRRLHTGMGPKTIGGHEWQGVSDPFGGQLVGVGAIEEPEFGQAPAIEIVMSGANKAFLKSMWDDRHAIEGAACDMSFATFDAETQEEVLPLELMFSGRLTAPRFSFIGASIRAIGMKVVSAFEGLNFPATRSAWSPSGQRERFPGDKGLDTINLEVVEEYKP